LANPETIKKFKEKIKAEYAELRKNHAGRQSEKNYVSIGIARENRVKIDWSKYEPPTPQTTGNQVFNNYSLEEIKKCIDWTPFFQTWMLKGKFPAIFEDKVVGSEASKLFGDAEELLDEIVSKKQLIANAVIGIYPANSVADDVEVGHPDNPGELSTRFHFLRQQGKKGSGIPNISLSDFIAPKSEGRLDYIGGFAVTTGIGIEQLVEKFQKDHDDYNVIMVKALADRLAEAFAELMHKKVRKDIWGYASGEALSENELIKEKYAGIRPAPGYPACPDHTEKQILFDLLDAEQNTGIKLTESFAMYPASAVSGFYFSHPDSRYFGLGKIAKDQVKEYAARKQMTVEKIEKWLAPNLSYD